MVTNWNQLFELGDPKNFSRKFTKFAIFQGKKPLNLPYLLDIARFWGEKFWKSPYLDNGF